MKTPYIINYMEEVPLQISAPLYYDNSTQINYLNYEKSLKAVSFTFGPQTTTRTEMNENSDDESVILGPDTTIYTETNENTDLNYYYGPSTTEKTAIIENTDHEHDNYSLVGPDTTRFTKSTEAVDADYMIFATETKRQTVIIENSEIKNFILGPDTTTRTFTVEQGDEIDIRDFYGPDTTTVTRATENSDEH